MDDINNDVDNPYFFNEINFPGVSSHMPHVINEGSNILGNLHDYCEVRHKEFASTFFSKLTSNTEIKCTNLRARVPHFIIKVLVSAKMIQKSKDYISCTTTYLRQFQKGKTYDYPFFMKKYINNYLKCHWKQPCKRKPKARTSRHAFSMTNSMSSLTKSTNSKLSSISIQSKDSSSNFNVCEAVNAFTNDSTVSDHVIPYEIDLLDINADEDLSIIV